MSGPLVRTVLPLPAVPEPGPEVELSLFIDGVTRVPGFSWPMSDLSRAAGEVGRLFDGTETLVLAPRHDPTNWVYQIALEAPAGNDAPCP